MQVAPNVKFRKSDFKLIDAVQYSSRDVLSKDDERIQLHAEVIKKNQERRKKKKKSQQHSTIKHFVDDFGWTDIFG